jgi:hypothetical protein
MGRRAVCLVGNVDADAEYNRDVSTQASWADEPALKANGELGSLARGLSCRKTLGRGLQPFTAAKTAPGPRSHSLLTGQTTGLTDEDSLDKSRCGILGFHPHSLPPLIVSKPQ